MEILSGTNLTIGGIRLGFSHHSDFRLEEVDQRYAPFLGRHAEQTGDIDVNLRIELDDMPSVSGFQELFDTGEAWSIFSCGGKRKIVHRNRLSSEIYWLADLSLESADVCVHCGKSLVRRNSGTISVRNPVSYPLDFVLIMYLLSVSRGITVHCAGARVGDAGLIFSGKSGSGKSTIAACLAASKDVEVFSDDRIIIREVEGCYQMFGTPWLGTAGIGKNRRAPLRGIFFIRHGQKNTINQITQTEALERLMPVVSVPWYDAEVVPGALSLCGDLLSAIPAYDLQFRPDEEVAEVIKKHARSLSF